MDVAHLPDQLSGAVRILVVGAGPVGLTLASELAARLVRVLVYAGMCTSSSFIPSGSAKNTA